MIEFEAIQAPDGRRSMIALNASTIATFEPSGDYTLVTLTSGRAIVASVPYSRIRRLIIEARSSFATTLDNHL